MPTYVYECTKCKNTLEVFHKISENPDIICPSCNSITKRVISGGAGIIYRGSGFYTTDYKNNNSTCNNKDNKKDSCSCCSNNNVN